MKPQQNPEVVFNDGSENLARAEKVAKFAGNILTRVIISSKARERYDDDKQEELDRAHNSLLISSDYALDMIRRSPDKYEHYRRNVTGEDNGLVFNAPFGDGGSITAVTKLNEEEGPAKRSERKWEFDVTSPKGKRSMFEATINQVKNKKALAEVNPIDPETGKKYENLSAHSVIAGFETASSALKLLMKADSAGTLSVEPRQDT